GTEAPLTQFTLALMSALRIYTKDNGDDYPCRPCERGAANNTFLLGEGAAVFKIEALSRAFNPIAIVSGIGFGVESLTSPTSISERAACLQQSMNQALASCDDGDEIDLLIMHAPGTLKGDAAEMNAIRDVFGDNLPALTTNKWRVGHSLGAAGALSVEFALHILTKPDYSVALPYENDLPALHGVPKRIMINTVGFGGNAVSLIISKP
ncbi:MAG: hypothetical protein KDD42_05825, partial [Bdellovibrionales bacterium]|nr:hypothetical protein [Bdellovibrionales bacterium]